MDFSKATDKRRFLRYEMLDYALVYAGGGEPINAVIVDIGLGGLQLRSKSSLPLGVPCKVQIGRQQGSPLELKGEVRHSGKVNGTDLIAAGVRFCPENHEDRLAIAEYVHSVFRRQCDKLLL